MNLPILKYVDVIIGFALVMILASTVVSTVTQLGSAVLRSRGRYLRSALQELFTYIDSVNLNTNTAKQLSDDVLRHTMIARPNPFQNVLCEKWKKWARLLGTVISASS